MGDSNDILLQLLSDIKDDVRESGKKSSDTQTCVNELKTQMKLHTQEMKYELKKNNELTTAHSKLLEEHRRGSEALQADVKLREQSLLIEMTAMDKRLNKVEVPYKWMSRTKKILVAVAVVITAIAAIIGVVL